MMRSNVQTPTMVAGIQIPEVPLMADVELPELLWHGTTLSKLKLMVRDGVLGMRHFSARTHPSDPSAISSYGVYLSSDREVALHYAELRSAAGGAPTTGSGRPADPPVLIAVPSSLLDVDDLKCDLNSLMVAYGGNSPINIYDGNAVAAFQRQHRDDPWQSSYSVSRCLRLSGPIVMDEFLRDRSIDPIAATMAPNLNEQEITGKRRAERQIPQQHDLIPVDPFLSERVQAGEIISCNDLPEALRALDISTAKKLDWEINLGMDRNARNSISTAAFRDDAFLRKMIEARLPGASVQGQIEYITGLGLPMVIIDPQEHSNPGQAGDHSGKSGWVDTFRYVAGRLGSTRVGDESLILRIEHRCIARGRLAQERFRRAA